MNAKSANSRQSWNGKVTCSSERPFRRGKCAEIEVELVDVVAPTVVDLLLLIGVCPHGHRSSALGDWPLSEPWCILFNSVKLSIGYSQKILLHLGVGPS